MVLPFSQGHVLTACFSFITNRFFVLPPWKTRFLRQCCFPLSGSAGWGWQIFGGLCPRKIYGTLPCAMRTCGTPPCLLFRKLNPGRTVMVCNVSTKLRNFPLSNAFRPGEKLPHFFTIRYYLWLCQKPPQKSSEEVFGNDDTWPLSTGLLTPCLQANPM